jgi:NADH dehydrogenase
MLKYITTFPSPIYAEEVGLILVTGSTGFVGRHVVKSLHSQQKKLRCLVRSPRKAEALQGLAAEISFGDVTDLSALETALAGVDIVIHLAAIIRESKGATFHKVNYQGTKNLVAAARKQGVRRIIYMSNLGAGPAPEYPFLRSKWLAEEEVRQSGMEHIILRPSIIYGEGDQFINTLASLIRRTPVVPVPGSGKTRFQPIAVKDVARCIVVAAENHHLLGQIVALGGPEHLSYEEILDIIIAVLKLKRRKIHLPLPLLRPGVWLLERLLPQPPVTTAQLAMLTIDNVTTLDCVENAFGFTPTPLREGIQYIQI